MAFLANMESLEKTLDLIPKMKQLALTFKFMLTLLFAPMFESFFLEFLQFYNLRNIVLEQIILFVLALNEI
jgi:hypothetical protein